MSPPARAIRVTFQDDWRLSHHRGLLDLDPRVRTLCRVLVSYPEVRHILPDRVSVDALTPVETLESMARFLGRQQWMVRAVDVE
jgi:hypothetical protein